MGFFSGLLSTAGLFALDTLAALVNGPAPKVAKDLHNKTYSSDAYGRAWPRCRGTVRLQGSVIAMSNIRTTVRKTTSGGLFGIGQQSVYYNTYSASLLVAFGKKLGGGSAAQFLRIIADGKDLFNAHVSDGAITGSVSVSVITGGQLAGSQVVLVDLAAGATLKVNATDLISVPGDASFAYEVQGPVNVTGPATQVPISIWPPLRVNLAGGGALSIFGLNASPYDLSSFDPDPHDGSHIDAGYVPGPGGIRFSLGSSTQQPDPDLIKMFGAGNSPGYRGLVCCWIHDLELANYGNRIPQWSGEIAFDTADALLPNVGPIANITLAYSGLNSEWYALPFSGNESLQWVNPLITRQQMPYVWVLSEVNHGVGNDGVVYRVNTQRNQLEASAYVASVGGAGFTPAGLAADADGYLYFIQNNAVLSKMDGMTLDIVKQWSLGFPNIPQDIYCFDTQQSLFGNKLTLKLAMVSNWFFDRTVLLRLGTANPLSTETVVIGYDKNGTPITALGNPIAIALNPFNYMVTDDAQGNIWIVVAPTLYKIDCQFVSQINPSSLVEYLALPSFSTTTVDVTSIVGGAGAGCSVQYYAGDNTIAVFGTNKMGKVSIATNAIIQTVTGISLNSQKISMTYDPMGMLVFAGLTKIDLSSLSIVATYTLSSFSGAGTPSGGWPVSDPYSNSVWYDSDNNGATWGGLNRAFLDRASGLGVGLDSIVSSIMSEAGFSAGQYDVTQLAGVTVYGFEAARETYAETLKRLMQYYLFDAAPIDGKIVFIPRGQASAITIPEADLGALGDPGKYEPRVIETLADPLDTPYRVNVHYYDPLKEDQRATQYAKRISQPYPSTLSSGKALTNSKQELDITMPITQDATSVSQQAQKILWELWVGRLRVRFKLGPKYWRLTPGDVVTLNYKGVNRDFRIEQIDTGASGAMEVIAVLQNASVYSSSYLPSSSAGPGSSTPPTQPSQSNNNYTISPAQPLSQTSTTALAMTDVVASFSSGLRTFYNARSIPISDPGAGNTQLYYVTVYDPNFTGEVPGTASLTVTASTTAAGAHVGESGYINLGTYLAAGTGVTGGTVSTGGQPSQVNGITDANRDSFSGDGSTTSFTLSASPLNGFAIVYWNGVAQLPSKYTVTGNVLKLSFTDASGSAHIPDTGDTIDVVYFT